MRCVKHAIALVAAASMTMPAQAEFQSLPPNPTPQQACTNLAQAKYKWNDPTVTDATRLDNLHADARGGHGPAIPPSERMIRIFVTGGMGNEGPVGPESVVAWQTPDAVWHVSRVFHSGRPPQPPEYPLAPKWPETAGSTERAGIFENPDGTWEVQGGELSPAAAASLEAMLAAPCFDREPGGMPADLPLRHGPKEYCYPDSAFWNIEIRERGKDRGYARPCRLFGPIGGIVGLIDGALSYRAELPLQRKTLYESDDNPTLAGLQDFFVHRLPGARWESPDLAQPVIVKSYRPTGPCTGEVVAAPQGDPPGEPITFARDWSNPAGIELWPEGATTRLYFKDRDHPDRVTLGGTVAALKVEGAAAWMPQLCKQGTDK
jgi:hypothetical protein